MLIEQEQPGKVVGWGPRMGMVALGVIVCLGLAVRVRQYAAMPSFWYDEAYLLVNVFDKSYRELAGTLRCDQAAPPLFLWALRGLYVWVGPSEWVMRLPAFVASVLALLVFFPLARKVAGEPGWMWAVGFCAVSHHAMTHAVEVKPYTLDLLMGSLLLLMASGMLTAEADSPARNRWWAGLLGVAWLGPWLSYPSVFLLGGASLALAMDAWEKKTRRAWLAWGSLNGLALLSVAAVGLLSARHQRTRSLEEYWNHAFLDLSSVEGVVPWTLQYLVKVGNYGTTSLGIPLVLLGVVGVAGMWQRSRALALLVSAPLGIAMVPNVLRLYPLDDRLLFFATPCVWLSAAAGVSYIMGRLRGRMAWVIGTALALLVVPGVVRAATYLVVVKPKAEFREAFGLVLQEEEVGDLWWVSHPEVAEVYLGKERRCLGANDPPAVVVEAGRGKRIWLVVCVPEKGQVMQEGLVQALEAAGYRLRQTGQLRTMAIFCAERPSRP
ncbi:MAG: glycosyltransferase family 39 protein [Gemmataceae bacterium]